MGRQKKQRDYSDALDTIDLLEVSKAKGGAPTVIKIDDDLKLTAFEHKFVHYILAGYTKTDAAIKAGSTAKNPNKVGWNTFQLPNVQEALGRAQKIRLEAVALNTTYVVENLMQVVAEGLSNKKLGDSVKALELLGKELGMFHEVPASIKKTKQDGLKSGDEKEDVKNDLNTWLKALPDDILKKQ